MYQLGSKRSVIRETFEYGRKRKAEIGADKVFDFSLGNPSVRPPEIVNKLLKEIIDEMEPTALHGYTSAPGDPATRQAVCDSLNRRFKAGLTPDFIYMTCGAAASLSCCISALCCKGDEFIALAPYFAEYKVFTEAAGGKFRVAMPDPDTFQIDIKNLRKEICKKTKAVILNSPNNPAGVVYSEKTIKKVCKLLKDKSEKYGHPIYLIADEPYREIVFDKMKVPFLINYYDNTLVCYSYSKSLSLPGERIGYVAVSPKAEDAKGLYAAVMGAGRALGYVCAPSLFQKLVARLPEVTSDISVYKKNRDILLGGLESFGYVCVPPQGAFYLFVKALEPDAYAFCEKAKKYELLLVPGDDFGCPGYVRIAYCVSTAQIENSLPAFKKLIEEYKNDRS